MTRPLTALFAAFEATLVLAIGIGITLAPLTVLWGLHYGFASDWAVFWRAGVDLWLVGHGVDIHLQLDPSLAAGLGLTGATAAFPFTIGALGFALLTVLLGIRAGSRVAETTFRLLGECVAVATFGLLSFAVSLSALYPYARPSLVQGALLPTLVFGVGVLIGSLRTRRFRLRQLAPAGSASNEAAPGSSLRDWFDDWPPILRAITAVSVRVGTATAATVIAVAAIVLAAMLAVNYAAVVSLYEGLHTGVLGGIAVTIGQLAFIPNLVLWVVAWLAGPGFAIGTGSIVSPLATQLGPIPAIPVFGALPVGTPSWGFAVILVPIVAGFLAAALMRPTLVRELGPVANARWLTLAGVGVGLCAGIVLGLLAGWAGGSAGPGRLAEVGPDALQVGLWVALEVSVGAVAGFLSAKQPHSVADPER